MGLLDTGKKCNKTKGEVDKSTITLDKFNTLLPINDKNGQKKISKGTEDPNSTVISELLRRHSS